MDDALIQRAFEVKSIPDNFDPSVPPSTGQEYLQHVIYEASRCPQIVVADIDRTKLKNTVNITFDSNDKCNEGNALAPTLEWQQHQVDTFSELRQKICRLRKNGNFQPVPLPKASDPEKWYERIFTTNEEKKLLPHLTVLLSMNELMLWRILEYHVDWLKDGMKPEQGRWIYAILACLSNVITSEECSTLRDLARMCAKLRCEKSSPEDPEVNALNLFICLVSGYFGQMDLAD